MTEYKNGINGDSHSELERMSARIAEDEGIHDLIGSTVHTTVSQYHSLLRKGLEQEVERILHEFTSATSDIEMVVNKRVKSRLGDIVRDEVQRIFDAALSNKNESIFGSIEAPIRDSIKEENHDDLAELTEEASNLLRDDTSTVEDSIEETDIEPQPETDTLLENQVEKLIEESEVQVEQSQDEEESEWGEKSPDFAPIAYGPDPIVNQLDDDESSESSPVNSAPEHVDDPADEVHEETNVDEESFEGTVRLNVEANDCIGEVVHFVRELRQKPQLRLLRMIGNNKDGVDIWLGLREPLQLRKLLPQIEGVSVISKASEDDGSSKERVLSVHLEPRVLEESATLAED